MRKVRVNAVRANERVGATPSGRKGPIEVYKQRMRREHLNEQPRVFALATRQPARTTRDVVTREAL